MGKVTDNQRDATYHCGIDYLLRAAYRREFNMMEMNKCKTKFPTFKEWFDTLNEEQKHRVEKALMDHFYPTLWE